MVHCVKRVHFKAIKMTYQLDPALAAMLQTTVTKNLRISKRRTNGYFFRVSSALNGEPIIVAVQMTDTANTKLGAEMRQVWIMPAGMKPSVANGTAAQDSVCGKCWFKTNGACYVNMQTPNSVYRSIEAGNYTELSQTPEDLAVLADALHGETVRVGAWGDPAAMPWPIMQTITKAAASYTAYTHQAAHPNFNRMYLSVCMVSAESPKQAAKYQELGIRTFRPKVAGSVNLENEITCPNETHGINCIECRLCDGGNARRGNPSIAVTVHGVDYKVERFTKKWGAIEVVNL